MTAMRQIAFMLLVACFPLAPARAQSCGTMNPNNVFISFADASAMCSNATTAGCTIADPIQFAASAFGYSFNCATHTFTWNFGDGTPNATSPTAAHVYSMTGFFTVTLTISNPSQTMTLSQLLPIGPIEGPPLVVRFKAQRVSGFDFVFTPDPTVAHFANEVEWDFGDGTVVPVPPSSVMFHGYVNPGTYRVTLRVNRTFTYSSDVVVVTRQRAVRH